MQTGVALLRRSVRAPLQRIEIIVANVAVLSCCDVRRVVSVFLRIALFVLCIGQRVISTATPCLRRRIISRVLFGKSGSSVVSCSLCSTSGIRHVWI